MSDEAVAVVAGVVIFEVKLGESGRKSVKGCGMDEVSCDSVIAVPLLVETYEQDDWRMLTRHLLLVIAH